MNQVSPNVAAEINRHHELASQRANEAVSHAKEAGKLLLKVKAELKHGEFLPWIEKNIAVTPRQVQRYIGAAQGKPPAVRAIKAPVLDVDGGLEANATRVASHLDFRRVGPPDWQPHPGFTPEAGNWYWCAGPQGQGYGGLSFVVEPSSAHPGFFFVSHIHEGGDEYDCTARPVRADWVEDNLKLQGLANPEAASWQVGPSTGVRTAMETLNFEVATNAALQHKETVEEAIARMERTNRTLRTGASA